MPRVALVRGKPARGAEKEAPPASGDVPPLPERAPPEIRGKPSAAKPTPETDASGWSAADIRSADATCGQLVSAERFEFKKLLPIRHGACGMPAPIAVKFINNEPHVEIRPIATMTCKVSDALDRWLRDVVQPRAWQLLDARVIRITTMSSYDCRTRNGGGGQARLSQHAFGNAIDIGTFVTAKGEHISVLEHWDAKDARAQFLREIQRGACGRFGTVLGPDANAAHRNHFHLDVTPRRHSAVCE